MCFSSHGCPYRGFLMCFRLLCLTREAFSNSILTLRLRLLAKVNVILGKRQFFLLGPLRPWAVWFTYVHRTLYNCFFKGELKVFASNLAES
jgi:hypothetical protein